MSIDSNSSAKRFNLERATNFMRQFRDPDSRELKKLSANQFMEVWSHYDRDGNGYIEGTELDGFLKEFVSSANFTDISPDMKSLLLVVMVAVAAVAVAGAASAAATEVSKEEPKVPEEDELKYVPDEDGVPKLEVPDSRQSLIVGEVGPEDRLMARITHNVDAAIFVAQDQDVTFRGVEHTNITSIQVQRTGTSQNSVPTIIAGGLGHTFVTINIKGRRDLGYRYTISIYSSINCSNS